MEQQLRKYRLWWAEEAGDSQQCGLRQHPSNKQCVGREPGPSSSILSIPIRSPGSTGPELLHGQPWPGEMAFLCCSFVPGQPLTFPY